MEYRIQVGDTITGVTRRLGTDWETLRKNNPEAVAKSSKTGNWIIKAGKTVSVPSTFKEILAQQTASTAPRPANGQAAAAAAPDPGTSAGSGEKVHTLKKGETIWDLARKVYQVEPEELMTFNNITEPEKLRVGQEIRIPAPGQIEVKTTPQEVVAGWYGGYHHGRTMANGKPYDMHAATIAHREIPIGTKVELENPQTGEKAKAVVTDRGPYLNGRDVDLSYNLAKRLSIAKQGVGNLKMRVL